MPDIKAQFEEIISKAKRIAVVSHLRPDADAHFSSISMYRYLKVHLKKDVEVMFEASKEEYNGVIPHFDEIKWTDNLPKAIEDFDTIVCLDATTTDRFSQFDLVDIFNTKTVITLDHHSDDEKPNYKAALHFTQRKYGSTSQLLGELIIPDETLKNDIILSKLLMYGHLGDTGGLKYIERSRVTGLAFAQKLIEWHDFQIQELSQIYEGYSLHDYEIIKMLMENTQFKELNKSQKIMFTHISEKYAKDNNLTHEKFKSCIRKYNYMFLRQVEDYSFGFIMYEAEDGYHISFRAMQNTIDVKVIAIKYNGFGIPMSAGGLLPLDYAADVKLAAEKLYEELKNLDYDEIKAVKE